MTDSISHFFEERAFRVRIVAMLRKILSHDLNVNFPVNVFGNGMHPKTKVKVIIAEFHTKRRINFDNN